MIAFSITHIYTDVRYITAHVLLTVYEEDDRRILYDTKYYPRLNPKFPFVVIPFKTEDIFSDASDATLHTASTQNRKRKLLNTMWCIKYSHCTFHFSRKKKKIHLLLLSVIVHMYTVRTYVVSTSVNVCYFYTLPKHIKTARTLMIAHTIRIFI